jgi:hypothetical protein
LPPPSRIAIGRGWLDEGDANEGQEILGGPRSGPLAV